jgi:hypothetical protein
MSRNCECPDFLIGFVEILFRISGAKMAWSGFHFSMLNWLDELVCFLLDDVYFTTGST